MIKKYNTSIINKKQYLKIITKNYKTLRLCIYKSNNHLYGQIINDLFNITLTSSSTLNKIIRTLKKIYKYSPIFISYIVGQCLGKKALILGIKYLSLDKNKFRFHGKIKALILGIKSTGILF